MVINVLLLYAAAKGTQICCVEASEWQDNWRMEENYGLPFVRPKAKGRSSEKKMEAHNDGAFRLNDWLVAIMLSGTKPPTHKKNAIYFVCVFSYSLVLAAFITQTWLSWMESHDKTLFTLADSLNRRHIHIHLPRLIDRHGKMQILWELALATVTKNGFLARMPCVNKVWF